ncbi:MULTISPECIES: carboxypeptidase regulatory-like domain-containing protein [unclassified Pseudoxanthomonas]|uniref:TonB-dependent receptor n=1 Tax=unclassified Pseudoxanthomonas TaxID=2645906 RepID=UPI001E4D39C6|nr:MULTISPECIES: carboxypeptidase regulatory-like domain-containing protein [unclassified Pseudoxanthomonas]
MSKLALGLVAALAVAPAFAQSTSSGVAGTVTSTSGQPVAGAEVTIVHVESGTVSRATTDANGRYTARGLRPGGPYTVTITSAQGTTTEEGVYLELNKVGTVNAALGNVTEIAAVQVTGSRLLDTFNPDNKGVSTSISGRQLETAAAGNRSLDDFARLDPRLSVDAGTGAISAAGVNNRFNEIQVDGISQGDPFGLNANGMPYTGSPISIDTIAAFDIAVTDYDVAFSTIGAQINAVTKSGTNELHGSAYYAFKDADSMIGKRDGKRYTGFDKDSTKGFTLGGPIVKDKLFFFVSAEKQEVTAIGGTDSDGLSTGAVTQQQVNDVIDAATRLGLFPGAYIGAMDLENERFLAKLDWNINDYHRASLTYQRTEEVKPNPYNQSGNRVVLSSHWYNYDSLTENTSLQLFSDWSENFSTEAKISYQKFDQEAAAFTNQPHVEVYTGTATSGPAIFLGEDKYRHENAISTKKLTASLFGNWYLGDHVVKGGFEYVENDVYNMFGRDLHGVYQFTLANFLACADGSTPCNYSRYDLRTPAPGYGLEDVPGAVTISTFSPFVQDTWQATDKLSLTYGVRVDIPKEDHAPLYNAAFEEAFGYRNNHRLGSRNKVVQPRVAFNYLLNEEQFMQVRGGFGLFQTKPPAVWLNNPYQNNGLTVYAYNTSNPATAPFSPDPYNQNVPGNGSAPQMAVDTLDPDFKLPTAWKANLGFDAALPWWDLVATVELQWIKNKDAILYLAPNIGTPNGTLPDGRASYWVNGFTTSSSASGKNHGSNRAFTTNSTLLTNTDKGGSRAITFALDKKFSDGWYANLSTTFTKAEEVNPGNSSQASSGYSYVARVDHENVVSSTADRTIATQVKLAVGWEHAFFGDYKTSITAFYNGHDGMPYSWTYGTDVNGDGDSNYDLAYIPLRENDPYVSYGNATAEQIEAFHKFIDGDRYLSKHRGEIAERNGARMPWVNQLDVSIQQELPGFFREHKSIVRLDIYNFLNLLNKDWGVTNYIDNGYSTRRLAYVNGITDDGKYIYGLNTASLVPYDGKGLPSRAVSRWGAMLTLKYQF